MEAVTCNNLANVDKVRLKMMMTRVTMLMTVKNIYVVYDNNNNNNNNDIGNVEKEEDDDNNNEKEKGNSNV